MKHHQMYIWCTFQTFTIIMKFDLLRNIYGHQWKDDGVNALEKIMSRE